MFHLITFSDASYHRQASLLKRSLSLWAPGIQFTNYTPSHLPSSLYKYGVLNSRGFGYWRWKFYIIYSHYQSMPFGSYLLYADSTMIAFPNLSKVAETLPDIYISKNLFPSTINWCKNLSSLLPDYTNFLLNGSLCDASLIGIRKNSDVNAFVDSLEVYHNELLFNDESVSAKEYPAFIDHRHDQSILSYLCWKLDVSYSPSLTHYSSAYPTFFHSRIRRFRLGHFLIKSFISYCRILMLTYLLRLPSYTRLIKINPVDLLR